MGVGVSKPAVERADEFVTSGKNLPHGLSGEDIYYHDDRYSPEQPLDPEPYFLTASPSRELPELPVEIWQKIFAHLRRRVGRISEKPRKGGEYHQRDLFNAMRVSKNFYCLAAPVLYARVVTDKPHLLFYGVRTHSLGFIDKYKRWSKLDLLQFIHRLDLMYLPGPVLLPDLRFPLSNKDKEKFETSVFQYTKDSEEIRRMIANMDNAQSTIRNVHRIRTLRETYIKSVEPVIMSNLVQLTISHPSFRYEYPDDGLPGDEKIYGISNPIDNVNWPRWNLFPSRLNRYKNKIDGLSIPFSGMSASISKKNQFSHELARICTPKNVCMDDSYGPYAYRRDQGNYDKIITKPPERITYHIYPRSVEKLMLPNLLSKNNQPLFRFRLSSYLFYGSTIRWVLDLKEWDLNSSLYQRGELLHWIEHHIRDFRKFINWDEKTQGRLLNSKSKQDEKTKIEIYGLLDNFKVIDEGLKQIWQDGWIHYELDWDYDRKINVLYDFLQVIPGDDQIKIMDNSGGICPACGNDASKDSWTIF
ncbi:uncharacterized protein L201_000172 [Kwoniella dendrophila CBS 6074]|uniref:F-box domain-containing protein n=1 Tax=Kwoniella dendrophila CBS 6074 TaxID=1295534 RepID=A0AAX4JLB2_9TREE